MTDREFEKEVEKRIKEFKKDLHTFTHDHVKANPETYNSHFSTAAVFLLLREITPLYVRAIAACQKIKIDKLEALVVQADALRNRH